MSVIDEYEKKLHELEDKKKKVYLQVFNTENGQYVLKDLKKLTALDSPVGCLDESKANYINGSRDILLYILNLIKEEERG